MKQILVLIFLVFTLKLSYSQDNFKIRYDYDAVGNANFLADNYSKIPVYVALDFSYLENASFLEELPYIKRIDPGTTPLFTIYREPDLPSPDFSLEIKWFISNPFPEVEADFPYLIPVKQGVSVLINSEIERENNRIIGFELLGSDEVVAARKGVVVGVIQNNDRNLPTARGNQFNLVQLLHEDGTIAEYYNFAFRQIKCQPGQTVIPGQILGKANSMENGNYLIGFSIFHSVLDSKRREFLVPEFLLESSKVSQVENGKKYSSFHTEKIILKELSGKEKRQYKKSQK